MIRNSVNISCGVCWSLCAFCVSGLSVVWKSCSWYCRHFKKSHTRLFEIWFQWIGFVINSLMKYFLPAKGVQRRTAGVTIWLVGWLVGLFICVRKSVEWITSTVVDIVQSRWVFLIAFSQRWKECGIMSYGNIKTYAMSAILYDKWNKHWREYALKRFTEHLNY